MKSILLVLCFVLVIACDYQEKEKSEKNQAVSNNVENSILDVLLAKSDSSKIEHRPILHKVNVSDNDLLISQPDTSKYVILDYDVINPYPFGPNNPKFKSTTLNDEEINLLEVILKRSIKEYNTSIVEQYQKQYNVVLESSEEKSSIQINLSDYKRQLVPYTNENDEKEVWVNCFCGNNWGKYRNTLLFVFDGGKCHFNLIINLDKKAYYSLSVNGNA